MTGRQIKLVFVGVPPSMNQFMIRIRGVETLHRTEYSIIPDQIEAGTFMFAAAATGGATLFLAICEELGVTP